VPVRCNGSSDAEGALDVFGMIVIVLILCCCDHAQRAENRRLRAMRRLVARYPPGSSYESPSPHQLLGDIARPMKASSPMELTVVDILRVVNYNLQ
jgi:hypothetical protein